MEIAQLAIFYATCLSYMPKVQKAQRKFKLTHQLRILIFFNLQQQMTEAYCIENVLKDIIELKVYKSIYLQ